LQHQYIFDVPAPKNFVFLFASIMFKQGQSGFDLATYNRRSMDRKDADALNKKVTHDFEKPRLR